MVQSTESSRINDGNDSVFFAPFFVAVLPKGGIILIEKATLSVKELAVFLGISETVAYRLTHSDGFPLLKLGKRRLIPIEELKMWIAKQSDISMKRSK